MRHFASLVRVYSILNSRFGDLGWWPGQTKMEIIAGAILTQNTAWSNVEKALFNLKSKKKLSFSALKAIPLKKLAGLIRPSGYFNQKAQKLKNFVFFVVHGFSGNLSKMGLAQTGVLRRELLGVRGIGPETADSILLYAFSRPVFVVDAYTKRIFSRLGYFSESESYEAVQKFFTANFKQSVKRFNQFHALIVSTGKLFCHKTKPDCQSCPLHTLKQCKTQG